MLTRRGMLKSLATVGAIGGALGPAAARAARAARDPLKGKVYFQDHAQYESLRQAASWNARKPNRFPKAIVLAESDADVVAAVKLARERGWQVTARSGGHSWSSSHTRDNSVQVNLAKMQQIEVDTRNGIARISPSVYGNTLNKLLREKYNLFTPSAHGVNVGMGGFVMCGGHGWHSRALGLGCENLMGLDLVNAAGELIHADERENSDYYWAARGSGPGFFGVATRYYMRVHPKPAVMRSIGHMYRLEEAESVIGWVADNAAKFPPEFEVAIVSRTLDDGARGFSLAINLTADSEARAQSVGAILEESPGAARTVRKWSRDRFVPLDVELPTDVNPTGSRSAVDNIWSNARGAELQPHLRRMFSEFPTPQSFLFIQGWGPLRQLPDMAYSVQADIYFAWNAVYYDPADDERCARWVKEEAARYSALSAGAQMNDENIAERPDRYLSEAAAARLEQLRDKYDPERRFPGFPRPA